ncbi:MAG: histidine phosphatase family protein [Candidatus Dormiibacterota bacterium]
MSQQEPTFAPTRYADPPGATRLILIRHGEAEPFRPSAGNDHFGGGLDPGLAPAGHEQARQVALWLASRGIGQVWSSPLRRVRETAAPLAERLGLEPLLLEQLREVHLGEWEGGVVHQRIHEADPLWAEVWRQERWDVIPGAEANASLRSRVRTALELIHSRAGATTVAVFTHDGVIAAALALATEARPFAFASSDHGSISEMVVEAEGRWRVRSFNEQAHLVPAGGRGRR